MRDRQHSSTSNTFRVVLTNSSTGAPLTGLTNSSTGLIISTICDVEATATAYTVAATNVETITTLGTFAAPTASKCRFREVDATNHPGMYEIQLADARFAITNARFLYTTISGATNLLAVTLATELTRTNKQDSVRFGMTALPNVASGSAGAIVTSGIGTAQLSTSSGLVTLAGVTHTGAVIPTVSAVTGLTASNLDATISSRMASYTQPTGFLAATFPTTVASPTNITSATGVTLAPTTGLGNQTANITGNLSGSVGSVTGAVGSVTARVTANTDQWNGTAVTSATVRADLINVAGVAVSTSTAQIGVNVVNAGGTAWGSGAITAGSIATGAFTNAKFASGAIKVSGDEFGNSLVITNLATASQIPANFTSALFASAGVFSTGALVNAPSGSGASAASIADAVWDEAISGHLTAGTTGAALNAAGGSGDPWSTTLPASYVAGQAGYILDQIVDKTNLITTGSVTYTATVGPNGQISRPIFIGDDYLASNGRAFTWDITARSGFSAATASCRFGIWNESLGLGFNVTGSVTDNGDGTWELSFDVSKTLTGALQEGNYRWTVELSNPSTNEVTEVYSTRTVEVREKQT